MQFHEIKRKTKNRDKAYVGRGGKRGKTSGKGTKGQNSRAGRKKRPELRDIIKKLPKLRGSSTHGPLRPIGKKSMAINLDVIEKNFNAGDTVNLQSLTEKGLVKKIDGKTTFVKILGTGALTKKITITGILVSAGAKEAIEKAGGSIS